LQEQLPQVSVKKRRLRRLLESSPVMVRIGSITLNSGENEVTTTQSDDTYVYAITSESFFPPA
jgi:hypothetical protein